MDDGPTCRLTVGSTVGKWLAAGEGSIDTVIRPPDGFVQLFFYATDSANNTSEAFRTVFVNSSTRQRPVATLPGRILDIDAARALVYDDTVSPFVVRLVDRATNASEVIWSATMTETRIDRGWLIRAARFTYIQTNSILAWLREWRGAGAVTELGSITGLHRDQRTVGGLRRVRPDHPAFGRPYAGTAQPSDGDAHGARRSDVAHEGYDVTSSGRVAFSADSLSPSGAPRPQIRMHDPGPPATTTPLTATDVLGNRYPLTDGVNVVFARRDNGIPGRGSSIVLRLGDGTEVVLADYPYTVFDVSKRIKINAGWVAFREALTPPPAAAPWSSGCVRPTGPCSRSPPRRGSRFRR